jgi:hypothetical protein
VAAVFCDHAACLPRIGVVVLIATHYHGEQQAKAVAWRLQRASAAPYGGTLCRHCASDWR